MSSKQDQEATLISHLEALHYFSPMEVFLLQLKISALLDCVLLSPYIAWNIWQFVLPALYDNEKRFIRSIVAMTSGLFIAGVAFCLIVCFPLIVQFGMSFASTTLQPVFGISNLVTLALWLSLAFGCMFQFPLVTYALIRAGIVNYETVCSKRPYVVVAILLFAAFLTPPDIISQLLLGAPTYLLFEAGLLAARRFHGRSPVHRAACASRHRAIAELGIRSPLRDCGFSKADIRELSRQLNLPTAEKPSFACLSSRFVYGETITEQKLRMVEKGESIARIEVLPENFDTVLKNRELIFATFKNIGFAYVSLDLQGYRTGSMNETLPATERSTAAI